MYKSSLIGEDIYTGQISINTDFYDYSTVTNTSLQNYSPLIYKNFNGISTVANEAGLDYGIFYDDWAIDSFLSSSTIPSGGKISYPLDSKTVQVKFDMTGSVDGFLSPIIKNIAVIVSEASLS